MKSNLITCLLLAICFSVFGQKYHLNKYKLGEGLTLGNDRGQETNLGFMVQPWVEARDTEDFENVTYRMRLRRARATLKGDISSRLSYRLRYEFTQGTGNSEEELLNGSLLDAFVKYEISKNFSVLAGQKSLYIDNKGMKIRADDQAFIERSRVVSSFASIRDIGVFFEGRHHITGNHKIKTFVEVVSGDGANNFSNNLGGLKYGGRVQYYPNGYFRSGGEFREPDNYREQQPKIAFGLYGNYNDGVTSRRGRKSGSFLYYDAERKALLPDYYQLGGDVLFKYKGFSAMVEMTQAFSSVPEGIVYYENQYNPGVERDFIGKTQDEIDTEVNKQMMLGMIFNIQTVYLFPNDIGVGLRWSQQNPNEDSFMNNDLYYNRENYYSLGITKYFHKWVKVMADVTMNTTGETAKTEMNGVPLNTEGQNEYTFRLMTQFIF